MSYPEPSNVAPWYLRNINQALALDEASGNVFVRTGFEGNIIISGNVNIPGTVTVDSTAENPVHVHLDEVGTSGILTVPWMPVSIDGNSAVTITSGNVRVTQGTSPWVVSGNVNANVSGNVGVTGNVNIGTMPNVNAAVTGTVAVSSISSNVTVVDGGGSLTIDGNVGVTGNIAGITANVNIGTMPEVEIKNDAGNAIPVTGNVNVTNITAIPVVITPETGTYFQFNNFGVNSNRGWTMQNTQIPMFAVRVKPGSGATGRIGEYELGNNNANQSTIGYIWYEGATITGAAYSWVDIGTSGLQYAIFTDAYGSNTPNGITGGVSRHSGIIIGKNSSAETEIGAILLTDGGPALSIAVQRMDNATKIDLWFAVTVEV
jgi:hypothetical protein